MRITRRTWIQRTALLAVSPLLQNFVGMKQDILQKKIPSSGENLPVIGLGTWQTFDVGDNANETAPLTEVLQTLVEHGGKLVDSSPMYGKSEEIVGLLSERSDLNNKLFVATKVWTNGRDSGIRQMEASMALLKRRRIDLMQIHNLRDWRTHLPTLRKWKEEGRIRYIGITHYTESAYAEMEDILKNEPIDFLQINYSIASREAEQRLFPTAMEKGVAVLINRPFEEGMLFRQVKGKPLPTIANELGCKSWSQLFLKFIISHPAVTCAIPGTSKPHHMLDNLQAGMGPIPDQRQRNKMIEAIRD